MNDAAIGMFDSGMGGLTVMRALMARLPNERFIYLGDTARLPYGTKSADTVTRYAVQAAGALMKRAREAAGRRLQHGIGRRAARACRRRSRRCP